jgi:hypothetical protein
VLVALGLVVFVLTVASGRAGLVEARRTRGNQALTGIIFFVLVLGILVAVRALRGDGLQFPQTPTVTAPAAGEGRLERADAKRRYEPEFQWGPVAALAAAGVGTAAFFLLRRRRSRDRGAESESLTADLTAVLDDTIDDLLAEPDARRAVIAAYARMERSLAAHGVPRNDAEAPIEYLDRASRSLDTRHPAARRLLFELTHLFERAKFSAQAVDRTMRDDAIETLSSLRTELRGGTA